MDDELPNLNLQDRIEDFSVTNNSLLLCSRKKHDLNQSNCNQLLQEEQALQEEQLYEIIKRILSREVDKASRDKGIKDLIVLIPKLKGIKQNFDQRIDYPLALNLAYTNVWQEISTFPNLYKLDIDNANAVRVRVCFLKWFNKILQRRIYDLYRELSRDRRKIKQLELNTSLEIDEVDNLEQIANQEYFDRLQNYLKHDPDRILQCHLKVEGVTKCTCQELIRRRLLKEPPEKWRDIAQELNLPQGTLTAFWNKKCKPILQQIPERLR
jgi:hypothetical protein